MKKSNKIVGYGICGGGEAKRYLRATLDEFQRLCDETIIVCNDCGEEELEMIASYGFLTVKDNREWGKHQWEIKQDLVKNHVAKLEPNLCIALDMDEVFDPLFTKEKALELLEKPFEAFYFYIINLWDNGYNPERNFWNIRAWKWMPELGFEFPRKNVHCGLAPEWVWNHAYYTNYLLLHYGLKKKADRLHKVQRYQKYDPHARLINKEYYDSLASDKKAVPFDLGKLQSAIQSQVAKTLQTPKKTSVEITKKEDKIAYVRNSGGVIFPINTSVVPLEDILKRADMEFVGWHSDMEKELDELLTQ